jgi:DNA-binding HxlR family transcriptional regulator
MGIDGDSARQQSCGLDSLITLTERRWSIPVLARLHRDSGDKFVALVNRLGVGRGTLSATLRYLMGRGLVYRNPGYGHPMRPEYLLTDAGRTVALHCDALALVIERAGAQDLAYRKWTLPLIAAIGQGHSRFRDLSAELTDASPRAITLGLKQLADETWIIRSVTDDYPPAAAYRLLPTGERVYAMLGPLL